MVAGDTLEYTGDCITNDCCFASVGHLVGQCVFPGLLFLLVDYDMGENVVSGSVGVAPSPDSTPPCIPLI